MSSDRDRREGADSIRFLFLGQGFDDPSTRYRLIQYIPFLESQGLRVRLEAIPPLGKERRFLFSTVEPDEVVVLQKRLLSGWHLRDLVRRTERFIYDFDDAVMHPDSFAGKSRSLTREGRFKRTIKAADKVIAGNEYLREKVEALGKSAVVLPTPVDTKNYSPGEPVISDRVTLGWIGSGSTLPYLEGLLPTLREVAALNARVRLKVVCDRFPRGEGLEIENKPWSLREELEDLRSFHIGLMPLLDDQWGRGKCGFKLLQYMAVGVPAVASPVGVNCEIIRDGVNGFLAGDRDEWVKKLDILINQHGLRRAMGEEARRAVEERYSLAANAPLFLETLTK